MRLIDKEELLNHMGAIFVKYPEYQDMYKLIRSDIRRAREVDAIPIQWIKAWLEQFVDDKGFYSGEGYDSVWDLLETWDLDRKKHAEHNAHGCIKENVK